MKVTVKKWGNSAAIRIPADVMARACLSVDQVVDVKAEAGRLVIEPARKTHFTLEELVKGITKDNRHEPIDWGDAVGSEVW